MKETKGKKELVKAQCEALSEFFENWYFNKLKEITIDRNLISPPENMLERLAISENEFYNIYIEPYKNLSEQDLNTVFKILAPELIETYTGIVFDMNQTLPFNGELKLKYDLSSVRKENALNWLLFQVDLLGIFKFSKELDKHLLVPYHQCYYCGKPNYYTRNGRNKKFNLKEVFCHKNNCQKGSNPEKHDNCCYAKWTRRRKSLEKALINAKNLAADIIENYEGNNASDEQKEILDNKLNKIFISFCEKQYQENLKIDYTIQTVDTRAINLKEHNL